MSAMFDTTPPARKFDSEAAKKQLGELLEKLVSDMEQNAPDESDRLMAAIVLRQGHVKLATNKISRFAGAMNHSVSVDTLRAAVSALDSALDALNTFLKEHPDEPEKSIFD